MWNLGNRAAVVLTLSVTCGCVLICSAWGAILALALTLLLVVYACYSLLANDSLVSPHAYQILGYLSEAVHELCAAFRVVYGYGTGQVRKLGHSASRCYREHFPFRMPKRRASAYQLSSDPCVAVKRKDSSPSTSFSTSRFSSIGQLSPIPHHSRVDDVLAMDGKFYDAGDNDRLSRKRQQSVFGKHTSTPVIKPGDREGNCKNGDVDPESRQVPSKRMSQSYVSSCGENITQFSPEGSPWGVSISPTMRPRPAGIKTVQTVAGPLLASTRYNIDPKVYTDVTSPGLTTRLTKYATEAKSKLIHQSQYGAGQFPKVNLYASPIPLLNAKSTKMRMPVTVRIAAPDVTKYSPPERQKILSNICHAENRSPTSVVQVLKEISLKRHASTEDVSFDAAKKQKTDSFFNEERELILEENKQKRSRDESSKSEEDLSPQSKPVRPAKRTKTRSCYDILNSLSSSMHVATGVKRKAVDFSRSGTPDFEKHFKSLENPHSNNSPIVLQSQNLDRDHTDKSESKEVYSRNLETLDSKRTQEFSLMKGILKSSNKESRSNLNKATSVVIHKTTKKDVTETNDIKSVPSKFVKLTEKLFMRAEPERNERLKSLVEEPTNIKVKFATDNVEEIKRDDIRNMRQTNMKARLQSMFDAISGKAENKINPDVVIEADDINATFTPPVTCSVTCATLNSLTTTTNINTTPLSTAAIIPSGSFSSSSPDAKLGTKPAIIFSSLNATPNITLNTTPNAIPKATPNATPKVTPNATPNAIANTKVQSNVPSINNNKTKETNDQAKIVPITPVIANTESLQKIISSTPSTTPTFSFGKLVTTPSNSLPNFGTNISNNSTFTLAATTTITPPSTSINFSAANKTPSSSTFALVTSSATIETKNIISTSASVNSSTKINTTQANPTFTLASGKSFSHPVTIAQSSISSLSTQSTLPVKTSPSISIAGFNNNTNTTSNSVTTTSAIPLSFTFGNSSTVSQLPKSNNFMFSQSNSNTQSKVNAFGNSLSQTTSLPQVTTKSFNFTSNILVTTTANNPFTNITNTTSLTTSTSTGLSNAPAFSLSTSTTTSTSTSSTSKPLFVFGTSNTSNTTSTTAVLPVTTASNITNFSGMKNNAVLAFGVSTTTITPQFNTPTITVPQFGVATTSIFATTSNTTTSTNIFGSTSNSQSFFGTASTVSGTTGIFNNPTTTVPSIFVTTTNTASSSNSTISSNLFANANTNLTPTTTTSSMFGSGTPIFGQTKLSPSFGTASGMFGNTTSSLFNSTTQVVPTTSTFSITGNVSTGTITSGFDSVNNTTLGFGTPNAGTSQTTSAFGNTTTMFGSTDKTTSIPLFGTNTTQTSGSFGIASTTSTFGTQNPTNLTFGTATSSSNIFGDNKSPFGATPATTTGFAGTSTSSSIPTFGTTNANNASNNTNAMFVFGSNQKDGQQNTTFSFGSNFAGSNNSTTASSIPFQFGSTSKSAPTGFNFTTPQPATTTLNFGTSAAPTFNPSTPGMFNIGSGSTAPRSRTIRMRKPR